MIADRDTNVVYFSSLIQALYEPEWVKIETILKKHQIRYEFLHKTKSIWCRDYMPIQVAENDFVQFQYNSTYIREKKYLDEKTTPQDVAEWNSFPIRSTEIILDGGNVVRSKDKVIISDRVYSDNRTWSRPLLIQEIEKLLNAEVIIIPAYPKDMTGHADGLVRFYDENTVLINSPDGEPEKIWYTKFVRRLREKSLDCIEVPIFEDPNPIDDKDIVSAVGIYVNFLEIGNLIILPVFASKELQTVDGMLVEEIDGDVLKQFKNLYREHIIEAIEINDIGRQGGLLNCITWNIQTSNP
jgi:agmatine deiminase